MMAAALQIPYKEKEFDLYREWTKNHDVRKIAFANALYRVKTGGHIQSVISGEYNHGKSTTAMLLTKWDTIYTRDLLKYYEDPRYDEAITHLHFNIKNSVIISQKDPASKYIAKPQPLRPYEVDEGYLWATTQEASEKKTTTLRDQIMQNRKKSPSMYWVYPNIFKMPSIILENMMQVIHKTSVSQGIMLAPSTVIQIKEKFDKAKIEKYAKKPRFFSRSMKWHSAFIFYPHFPRMKGAVWNKYLAKYEKYKVIKEEQEKTTDSKLKFFGQLDALIDKNVISVGSKNDVAEYIKKVLQGSSKHYVSDAVPTLLANEYIEWKTEKVSKQLFDSLTQSSIKNLNLDNVVN
jgi:hypothetical protein